MRELDVYYNDTRAGALKELKNGSILRSLEDLL